MELTVTQFRAVDLPNCLETIWRGKQSTTMEAPLLANFCITVKCQGMEEELFFEVRDQTHGPLIDEYYEDQIYETSGRIAQAGGINDVAKVFNELMEKLVPLVYEAWQGKTHKCPLSLRLNT